MGLRRGQLSVESHTRRIEVEALHPGSARYHPCAAVQLHAEPPLELHPDAEPLARLSPHDSQLQTRRRGAGGNRRAQEDFGADGGHLRRGEHEAQLLASRQVQRRTEPNRPVNCVVVIPSPPPTNFQRVYQRRTGRCGSVRIPHRARCAWRFLARRDRDPSEAHHQFGSEP